MKRSVMRLIALVILAPLCISIRADFLGAAVGGAIGGAVGSSAASSNNSNDVSIVCEKGAVAIALPTEDYAYGNEWYYDIRKGDVAIRTSNAPRGCAPGVVKIERMSVDDYIKRLYPSATGFSIRVIVDKNSRIRSVVFIVHAGSRP